MTERPVLPPITLRDYQEEAIAAIEACEAQAVLIALATGLGKTVVFCELIRRRGGRALILAHRDELVQQALAKMRAVAPELALCLGVVKAERNDVDAEIIVGSVQTLASPRRLAQLVATGGFATVVIDEAHHALAENSYGAILRALEAEKVVGVTATPERHDKRKGDLRNVFQEVPFARSLEWAIRKDWLCDLEAIRVEVDDLDLSKVKKSRGDFQASDLGRAMEDSDAIDETVAAYLKYAQGKQCVAFFPTVETSKHAAAAFWEAGVMAGHVDGFTDPDIRKSLLKQLASGKVQVVCNVGVLTEGWDEPSIECVICAAPTKSRIRYAQQVGRGTRLHTFADGREKTSCLVLDLCGVSDDLSIQSVGTLFGLAKPPRIGETATEAKDREKYDAEKAAERKARQHTPRSQPLKPKKVRGRKVSLFTREDIAWSDVGGRRVVGLSKDRHIVLDPQGDTWRVLIIGDHGAKVAAKNLDLGYAKGAAEQILRDAGSVGLADKLAPWRDLPATRGQHGRHRRLGGHPMPGATKGQLADAITARVAAQRLARLDAALAARNLAAKPEVAAQHTPGSGA